MDQNQQPITPASQPEQDDVQALRDRVRQLEEELARKQAQADARPHA